MSQTGDGRGCCTKHLHLPDRVLDASPSAVTSNLHLVILGTADGENVQWKSKLSPKEKYLILIMYYNPVSLQYSLWVKYSNTVQFAESVNAFPKAHGIDH